MRITRIKLAGFKSFVDPTTLSLPGNLTGVVGPNGCGKSNIIDALIWVMGESSAKHLRGDSMADVIFNGSNTRKPVGQATVEIVFDNSDGTIGGQYAGFGEISIKRSITRDGISSYFLNGARCRRKDITNVFLGTGIGARGYSVIEQGTISRVIEARPEELRGFLEEAAGISKYKERRRETENRMRHTGENMERLNDIRQELDKQLGHLQRQARAAERYQALKADERRLEARALAVRGRALEAERAACHQLAGERANQLEAAVARLREIEAREVADREASGEASAAFHRVQTDFYALSGEISRLEQAIKHAEEREQALQQNLSEARQALDAAGRALADDSAQFDSTRHELAVLEPDFARQQASEQVAFAALRDVEQRLESWQHEWDAFNREHSALAQREHAAQIRLENLRGSLAADSARSAALGAEASRNETVDLTARIAALGAELGFAEDARTRAASARIALRANLSQHRGATQALVAALHEQQSELQQQRGRLASLQAAQEAAYGDDQEQIAAFLRARGVGDLTRLAEYVDIEAGWERALEAALRVPLGAVCGDDLVGRVLDAERGTLAAATLTVVDSAAAGDAAVVATAATALLAKVRSRLDLAPLLGDVHVADSLASARTLLQRLPPAALVVLKDGTLLGRHWAQVPGDRAAAESILARERAIVELGARIDLHDADTANLRRQVEAAQGRLAEMEQAEHAAGEAQEHASQAIARQRGELGGLEAEFQRRRARAADVHAELERLARQSAEVHAQIERLESERAEATRALTAHAERREALGAARTAIQHELDASRAHWRAMRDGVHAQELRLEQLRARHIALAEATARNTAQREQAARRCADLEGAIVTAREPRGDMRERLEQALATRLDAEAGLAAARTTLGNLEEALRRAAAERGDIEQTIQERQHLLEQARLDERALDVRMQELGSRFAHTGEDYAAVCASLDEADSAESVQAELEALSARIARLGPINLAAIDEFTQLSERKDYLDRQHADLSEALATLAEAIRKIDRETRTRFKDTFDKVNNGLQAMFPVLVGGGHAYLELTGDDLLETGVTVMARPPGKRNSTIHLLSGGEKALTALAFVFAIFELNPAPFCLLDEVDAPLDDANVARLTEMLQSMAKSVQFLYVTHNKITMEIAAQLIGVTMQEPGVSRLVAVNMEEAVELAATA